MYKRDRKIHLLKLCYEMVQKLLSIERLITWEIRQLQLKNEPPNQLE